MKFLRWAALSVGVVFALLARTANIKEMLLEGVTVTLVVDEDMAAQTGDSDIPAPPDEPRAPAPPPDSIMQFEELAELTLRNIAIDVQRPSLDRHYRFLIDELSGNAVPGQPLALTARGSYQEEPYSLEIGGAAVEQMLHLRWAWPVSLKGDFAGVDVALNPASDESKELAYQLTIKGNRLDQLNEALRVYLPPWGPYVVDGLFHVSGNQYAISDFAVRIRESHLAGELQLDMEARPMLDVKLVSHKLRLEDFDVGDWSPVRSADPTLAPKESSPDEEHPTVRALLNPELMRDLDLSFSLEMQEVLSGDQELGKGSLHLTLEDGRFTLDPLAINLPRGPVVLSAVVDTTRALRWRGAHFLPDEVKAELGGATIDITQLEETAASAAADPAQPSAAYRLSIAGERLDGFDRLAGASLPPAGPYELQMVVDVAPDHYIARDLELRVGSSELVGNMELTTTDPRPRADINLTANTLQLGDFIFENWSPQTVDKDTADPVPASGSSEDTIDKDAVSALLSRETLLGQDGTLAVSVKQVLLAKAELGSGELKGSLENAKVTLDALDLNIPGGTMHLHGSYEPTDTHVNGSVGTKIEQFDYGILARHLKPGSDMDGHFSLDVELMARAPEGVELMHHANGHFVVGVWPGNFEAGVFDLWAANLLVAVIPSVDKEKSKVNCAVGRFKMADGLMSSEAILLDTSRMQVDGEGTADFKTETVAFQLKPTPKKPQFFSAATPIEVNGKFTDFNAGVAPGALVGTAIRMVTSVVVTPLKKLTTADIPADGKAVCEAAYRGTE